MAAVSRADAEILRKAQTETRLGSKGRIDILTFQYKFIYKPK